MKLDEFLSKTYNYNVNLKNDMQTYIEQRKSWYKGNVRSFHNYFIYNGQTKVKQKRFTMNMAKEICEDWADILWSEKCQISLKDETSNSQFEELTNTLDLYVVINQVLEKAGALGTAGTVVSIYDIKTDEDNLILDVTDAKSRIDVVDVDDIYPLSWSNTGITECAFASVQYISGKKYVVCSVHKLNDEGNYVIYNHLFLDSNGNLTEILDQQDTITEFDTKSNVKWFSIFKPLLTNNIYKNNPYGISYYANAIDQLKAVDISFDALKNEVQDGRKRTFVRSELLNYDDGTQKMVFDKNDISVYVLPQGAKKDDLIQSDSDALRTTQQIDTLNTNLNILGNKVGFGENHYHFNGTILSTATAVISSNSKMFRRKKKLEIGYESSIYDLVKAICYSSTAFGNYNISSENMSIQFDDSIIEDKEAESNRASREVGQGIMSKAEYREKIFGETEEIAKKKIQEIEENNDTIDKLLNDENTNDEESEKETKEKVNKNTKDKKANIKQKEEK